MTHDELVKRAATWLRNTCRCAVVITEMASGSETPDAIGWNGGGGSTLIECKATMADFRADAKKHFRRPDYPFALGCSRYYFVPQEIASAVLAESPEEWGVIGCSPGGRKSVLQKATPYSEYGKTQEISLLISSLRRIAGTRNPLDGMNVKCYLITGDNPVATLGIAPDAKELIDE